MAQYPSLQVKFGESVGVDLMISHPELDTKYTFLSSDNSAGTTLNVDDGTKFSSDTTLYTLIGQFGAAKSEIAGISSSTATVLTTDATTTFPHNRGELVTLLPYNQIRIQYSTDSGSNYSTLATISINPTQPYTYYNHSAGISTNYYRVLYINQGTSAISEYSDGLIASGFPENSVGGIIQDALVQLGEQVDSVVTREFLLSALNDGRNELDNQVENHRWSFRTSFNYDAGNVIPGENTLTLPSTLRSPDTWLNIMSVRIGTDIPLTKTTKDVIDLEYVGIAKTTLATSITGASTSLVLTSSGDFDESGSVVIAASTVSQTLDTVAYTTNTESTATLGTVTGIADSKSSGVNVWQHATFGLPTSYTVFEDALYFNVPFDDQYAGENIWLDFYTKRVKVDSDGDLLDEPNPRAYIPYLKYRIKQRRDRSFARETDSDYIDWISGRTSMVRKEFSGRRVRFIPNVPC